MPKTLLNYILIFLILLSSGPLEASSKTEVGLSLLETPSARAHALAEAFSAVKNDVSGFSYNPALLATLTSGHATTIFKKGIDDDTYGQITVGVPFKKGGAGFSIGYFDEGIVEVFDGTTKRTVVAQRDIVGGLGLARTVGPLYIGGTAKFISSELAEQSRATALAADIGMSFPFQKKGLLSASFQNLGTKLTYDTEGFNLPQIFRLGFSWEALFRGTPTTLFIDQPYFLNQNEFNTSLGIERYIEPLALRVGFRDRPDRDELSFGLGFFMDNINLDYAMGVVNDLGLSHHFSLSFRFKSQDSDGRMVKIEN